MIRIILLVQGVALASFPLSVFAHPRGVANRPDIELTYSAPGEQVTITGTRLVCTVARPEFDPAKPQNPNPIRVERESREIELSNEVIDNLIELLDQEKFFDLEEKPLPSIQRYNYTIRVKVGERSKSVTVTSGPGGSSFPTAFVKIQDRIRELADLKSEGNPAPPGPDATKATEVEELGKWIMTYYQNPDPKCFVERVRGLAAAKLLHDSTPNARPDANVMFLGKIMAANAPEIADWMAALSSLSEADFAILKRAVWYSGTAEGAAWLAENGEADLANGPRPMLLSDQKALSMQPYHIDQLWEWFFATGDKEPVVQIVRLFSLAHELPKENSLDLLSPPKESDDSTQRDIQLYNYRLVKPALWSTTSLAIQHDRVYEIVKECADEHHHPMIKAWLGQILRIADAKRSRRRLTDPKQ